ncbi:unnamed protein product [Lactuca saligna]|uniref:Uncharacterized protein n=1 Tax=Lactuca saligna TaxID=75948 RepID=A0AA35ZHP6_LACSI|nr:unnamed protein product [Lactuca saligna]
MERFHPCHNRHKCRLEGAWEDGAIIHRAEAEIYLVMTLRGHYRGKLCHREVDLVDTFPPPVSEKHMRELVGLLPVEEGNVGSIEPASSSQLVVEAIFPVCFPASAFADIPVVDQAQKDTLPIWKKRSMRVVLLSDEEIKSDDVGLRPRKMRNTVFVPKHLGDIRDVLGDGFLCSGRKRWWWCPVLQRHCLLSVLIRSRLILVLVLCLEVHWVC